MIHDKCSIAFNSSYLDPQKILFLFFIFFSFSVLRFRFTVTDTSPTLFFLSCFFLNLNNEKYEEFSTKVYKAMWFLLLSTIYRCLFNEIKTTRKSRNSIMDKFIYQKTFFLYSLKFDNFLSRRRFKHFALLHRTEAIDWCVKWRKVNFFSFFPLLSFQFLFYRLFLHFFSVFVLLMQLEMMFMLIWDSSNESYICKKHDMLTSSVSLLSWSRSSSYSDEKESFLNRIMVIYKMT